MKTHKRLRGAFAKVAVFKTDTPNQGYLVITSSDLRRDVYTLLRQMAARYELEQCPTPMSGLLVSQIMGAKYVPATDIDEMLNCIDSVLAIKRGNRNASKDAN